VRYWNMFKDRSTQYFNFNCTKAVLDNFAPVHIATHNEYSLSSSVWIKEPLKRRTLSVTERTSPPQSHLRRARRYPHVGECTVPLPVLAVGLQCTTLRNCYGTLLKRYGTVAERCMQDVMETLRERYGTLWKRCGSLRDVTEHYRSVAGTLQDAAERYGILRSVAGR